MFEYSDFDDFIEFPVKYKTTINGFNFSTLPPRTLMEHIKERLMRGSRTYAYGHPHNFTAVFLGTEFDETLQNGIESDGSVVAMSDPEYEQFLADIWVGIVLTLMVLSCVCCMCSCLLYHKFQQWKRHVLEGRARNANNVESGGDTESLPSYTIVSGLPSYEEALEQLKQVKTMTGDNRNTKPSNDQNAPTTLPTVTENVAAPVHDSSTWQPHTPPTPNGGIARLSVADLFQIYRHQSTTTATQISPTISSNIETSNKC